MSTSRNNGLPFDAASRNSYGAGEDTLRLIAGLPAPEELAERVKAGLRAAPEATRILMWRSPLRPAGGWMYGTAVRGAAAAAIVCVVAGGGWRIYSHVQPAPAAKVVVVPSPVVAPGSGFSNSNARRVPETLQGPVLTHPMPAAPEVNVPEVNVVDKTPAPRNAARHRPAVKKKAPAPPVFPVQ